MLADSKRPFSSKRITSRIFDIINSGIIILATSCQLRKLKETVKIVISSPDKAAQFPQFEII